MKRLSLALILPFITVPATLQAADNFPMMLAESYDAQNVSGWLASEKLDGVRSFWDGKQLHSRGGHIYNAPNGFSNNFPDFPLDGELYIGRGKFDETSGKVRAGKDWTDIKYYVFDVPDATGGLPERLKKLQQWLIDNPNDNIIIIEQKPVKNIAEAQQLRQQIEEQGGEGVMLRNPNSDYITSRTQTMLKLKSYQDAECTVIEYIEGKGKYIGKLGALKCRLANGNEIKIGSGFTDAERDNPPAIGTEITFRYNGLTKTGKPRFARFWRIRK